MCCVLVHMVLFLFRSFCSIHNSSIVQNIQHLSLDVCSASFFPFVFVYCLIFSSRIFSNTYCHIQTSTSSADFFRSTTRLCQIAVWWKRKKSERSNSSDLLMKSTKAVATTFHPCHQQFVIEFLVCNSCGRRNVFNSNTLSHYF